MSISGNIIIIPILEALGSALFFKLTEKSCSPKISKNIFTYFRRHRKMLTNAAMDFKTCGRSLHLAKTRSKQKRELRKTVLYVISYLLNISSLFIICQKVLPDEKFHTDLNFRQNLQFERSKKYHIDDLWDFLTRDLVPFVHLHEHYNGDKVSRRNQKFNSDQILFRLGSARLYQFSKRFKMISAVCPLVHSSHHQIRS